MISNDEFLTRVGAAAKQHHERRHQIAAMWRELNAHCVLNEMTAALKPNGELQVRTMNGETVYDGPEEEGLWLLTGDASDPLPARLKL